MRKIRVHRGRVEPEDHDQSYVRYMARLPEADDDHGWSRVWVFAPEARPTEEAAPISVG
jgi:hypothetical protein